MRFRLRHSLLPLAVAAGAVGCATDERPSGPGQTPEPEAGVFRDAEAERDGPPLPDASGLCGNQIIQQRFDPPNLYFLFDRSGSMEDRLAGSGYSKYTSARMAVAEVLRAVGHRVRYGAAVLPAFQSGAHGCDAGEEVFSCRAGDPVQYALAGEDGPILRDFLVLLGSYAPDGGTPVAPTLEALAPTLTELEGDTALVLATDGEPNCNPHTTCSGEDCSLNAIGAIAGEERVCGVDVNCCDATFAEEGPLFCIDGDDSVEQVASLHEAGIRTYVIGLPGSEDYSDILEAMAEAGGTAREEGTRYYPVERPTELTETLLLIGTTVAISCDVELVTEPPDPELVNVYFDATVVPSDEEQGWVLTDRKRIEVRGAACGELKSGRVFQLQVVAGCPTVLL